MVDFTRLAHTSSRAIRCCFYTLAIRRAALKEKYRGGLRIFMDRYHARTNRHLVVMCEMSGDYLDRACGEIIENGLKSQEDFLCFEAFDLMSGVAGGEYKAPDGPDNPFDVDDSEWLKGYYKDGGMMIWYGGK